jgi:hypothetical protein
MLMEESATLKAGSGADEIGHFANANAVGQVAHGAPELESEREAEYAVLHRRVEIVEHYGDKAEERRYR